MIKLDRLVSPNKLTSGEASETQLLWDIWTSRKKLVIKRSLYGCREVKDQLKAAQFCKCAYCEISLTRRHGHVEHFRPKEGWKQTKSKKKLNKPGYFWLAYTWSNLLVSCEVCNDKGHKGNLFPLVNPTCRAKPDSPSISAEVPLLLNPYDDNPMHHIEWHAEIPVGITPQGEMTVETFGLDRDKDLIEDRRDYLNEVSDDLDEVERGNANSEYLRRKRDALLFKISPLAPHSSATLANFGQRINEL